MPVPFTFEFTFDSAGSPDNIVLPADFPAMVCTIRLKPPIGQAWTFYAAGTGTQFFSLSTDEELSLGPQYFEPGQIIGRAALDTGSGTGRGVAS